MIRQLWLTFLDAKFGPKCLLHCGERVKPRDLQTHVQIEHAGDVWVLS